jgi:hypothetical protein
VVKSVSAALCEAMAWFRSEASVCRITGGRASTACALPSAITWEVNNPASAWDSVMLSIAVSIASSWVTEGSDVPAEVFCRTSRTSSMMSV